MPSEIILETDRIYLRKLNKTDCDDLCEILQDTETMYAYEHAFCDEEVRAWLENQLRRYADDGFGLWALIDRVSGVFVGQAGLTWQNTDRGVELEMGYLLKKRFWHQGYATEAACACRDYAFHSLNKDKVVAIIRDNNYSSRKVAERVGMKREHSFVKHYYGLEMPHIIYGVSK